jgi:hypothetical protein
MQSQILIHDGILGNSIYEKRCSFFRGKIKTRPEEIPPVLWCVLPIIWILQSLQVFLYNQNLFYLDLI